MAEDNTLAALTLSERLTIHYDLRVIARAEEMAMIHLDESTATVGQLFELYKQRWTASEGSCPR